MIKKAFLVCLVSLMITSGAYAGGLALSGIGSKAIGMGGAFRGLADNWSAAYWNPAGLTQLSESEFNLMAIAINPMPEYNPDIWYGGINDSGVVTKYDVGYKNGEFRYPDDKTHFAPNLSGFYKLPSREDVAFGVAVFVPYALGSDWDLFDPVYGDAAGDYPEIDHKASLQVIDIHPSVAKSFMDGQLSVGAGISIMKGEIEFQKTDLLATGLPYPHDNIAADAFIKGEGWGYGANFGILYKLNDKLQIGISGKTPTTLKTDGDVDIALYSIDNDYLHDVALGECNNAVDSVAVDFIFSSVEDGPRTWSREATAELKLPADIGLGFAYQASEKLMLTMDFTYTLWSALDSIIIDMDGTAPPAHDPTDTLLVIRTKWEDIFRFSIGGQYQVIDPFALRFGFYLDPSPIPDETFSPLFMDIGSKYSGNLGASIKLKEWEIGYNFEYIHFAERNLPYDDYIGSSFDNYPGVFKAYLIANHLSITYRF